MERRFCPLAGFILVLWLVAAQAAAVEIGELCRSNDIELDVEISSRSGSPLLLELLINDPDLVVDTVTLSSDSSSATFAGGGADPVKIALRPFQQPGDYELTLTVATSAGTCTRQLEIGFIDFVWGRDNFRFSNARSVHGSARPYSAVLFPWADERFGELQPEEQTMMLRVAYGFFGGAIGRCYAFSGSQLRFMRDPQLLPSFYESIYAVREPHRGIQQQMNMLQNDIVFNHFVTNGYAIDRPQSLEALHAEVDSIVAAIAEGRPVAFGYLAPQRHHSMLAYGYLADPASEKITLITANNWGDEVSQNLLSRAAERITINLDPDHDNERIRWIDSPIREYRSAEHLFVVDVKDEYRHSRAALSRLLAQQREQLQHRQRALVIVEEGRDAFVQDDNGNRVGRYGRRIHSDMDNFDYRQYDDVHIFEFPAREKVTLHVSELPPRDDGNPVFRPNVFVLTHHGSADAAVVQHAVYKEIEIPDNEYFTLLLSRDGLQQPAPPEAQE